MTLLTIGEVYKALRRLVGEEPRVRTDDCERRRVWEVFDDCGDIIAQRAFTSGKM